MLFNEYHFFCNCASWDSDDVDAPGGLCDLVDNCEGVSRATFLRHVNRDEMRELEANLGYKRGSLVMSQDNHVTYFRSVHHGETVYGFCWSAIEYIFKRPRSVANYATSHDETESESRNAGWLFDEPDVFDGDF